MRLRCMVQYVPPWRGCPTRNHCHVCTLLRGLRPWRLLSSSCGEAHLFNDPCRHLEVSQVLKYQTTPSIPQNLRTARKEHVGLHLWRSLPSSPELVHLANDARRHLEAAGPAIPRNTLASTKLVDWKERACWKWHATRMALLLPVASGHW